MIAELEDKIRELRTRRDEIDAEIADLTMQLEQRRALETSNGQSANGAWPADEAQAPELNLSQQLTFIDTFQPKADSPEKLISKSSPIEEKYELFMSLFAGRPDVHAKRWQSAKTGKAGYSPVCNNHFNPKYCSKSKDYRKFNNDAGSGNCIECANRSFPTITLADFEAHIDGGKEDCSDVLGAYPTDAEEKCSFVVADFDNENRKPGEDAALRNGIDSFEMLKNAALAFRRMCLLYEVPAYLEISRSGNGIHVWVFFSGRVEAKKARRLCISILTAAMNKYPDVRFNSYDRLIPSQDTLPKNGVGNLIALPLQGRAGKHAGRYSLFVDEELNHYPDQWEYLSAVRKIGEHEIDVILEKLSPAGELGELLQNEEGDEPEKPWEKKRPEPKLTADDAQGEIAIVSANMVHIAKPGLSPRLANRIRRLGAFKNPEFYKMQAQRISTWDIPHIISTAEETAEYISLPRGAEPALRSLLDEAGIAYRVEDKTTGGNPVKASFSGELYDEQIPAAEAMAACNTGVLFAAPAFGKTVIGAYLIADKKVNALVMVDRQPLLGQWKGQLEAFLSIDEELPVEYTPKGRKKKKPLIGEYSGARKNLSGIIDVATFQSLHRGGEVKEFVKDYGLVIVDECHHVPAASFEAVLKQVNARYVYGLSATPMRSDGHHVITFLQLGPIRYRVDAKEQANKRPFDHFVVPRFTGVLPTSLQEEKNYVQALNDLTVNEARNKMIIEDIVSAVEAGRTPLVLTERVEHASILAEALADKCERVIKLVGGMGAAERREATQILYDADSEAKFAIVAIGKLAGEGFDCPRLDTLFLTLPFKSKANVTQYTGRLHRLVPGKADVMVYDYVDANIPMLEAMYYLRIRAYRSIGYKTITFENETEQIDIIFGPDEYFSLLLDDMASAKKEIVVSSPFVTGNRIKAAMPTLSAGIINNVVVTVVTKPPEEYLEKYREGVGAGIRRLQDAGARVALEPGLHQKYAVIDQHIVWYGSINPIGFSNKDENIMRLDSADIAAALLNQKYRREPKEPTRNEYRPKQLSLFNS